jgi:hypothetical protein
VRARLAAAVVIVGLADPGVVRAAPLGVRGFAATAALGPVGGEGAEVPATPTERAIDPSAQQVPDARAAAAPTASPAAKPPAGSPSAAPVPAARVASADQVAEGPRPAAATVISTAAADGAADLRCFARGTKCRQLAATGIGFVAVGLALLATGLGLTLRDPGPPEGDDPTAAAGVSLTGAGIGTAVTGGLMLWAARRAWRARKAASATAAAARGPVAP